MANGNNPNPRKTSPTSTPRAKKTTTTKASKPKAESEGSTLRANQVVEKPSTNNEPIALQLFAPYGGLKKVGGQFAFEVLPGEEPQMFRDATEAIMWLRDNRLDLDEVLVAEGIEVPTLTQSEENEIEALITRALEPSVTQDSSPAVGDVTPVITEDGDEDEKDESLNDLISGMGGMTGEERTKAIALMNAPLSSLIFGDVNTETPTGIYNHEYTQKELAEYLGLELTTPLNVLMIAVAKKGHGLQLIGGGKYKITA